MSLPLLLLSWPMEAEETQRFVGSSPCPCSLRPRRLLSVPLVLRVRRNSHLSYACPSRTQCPLCVRTSPGTRSRLAIHQHTPAMGRARWYAGHRLLHRLGQGLGHLFWRVVLRQQCWVRPTPFLVVVVFHSAVHHMSSLLAKFPPMLGCRKFSGLQFAENQRAAIQRHLIRIFLFVAKYFSSWTFFELPFGAINVSAGISN